MKKHRLILLIPILLLSLACNGVTNLFSPRVEVIVAPVSSARWDSVSLQQAGAILSTRMKTGLKGRFSLQVVNDSQISIGLYDPNDMDALKTMVTEIGAVDFVASAHPVEVGTEIDHSLQIIMTDADVSTSMAQPDISGSGYMIAIGFTKDGASKLAAYSKNNIRHSLAIVRDNKVISSPYINSEIQGSQALIQGNFNEAEARQLAAILASHRLPFALQIISVISK